MLAIHGEKRKNVYQRELELLWSESFNDFGWTCLSVVVCSSIGKAKPLFKVGISPGGSFRGNETRTWSGKVFISQKAGRYRRRLKKFPVFRLSLFIDIPNDYFSCDFTWERKQIVAFIFVCTTLSHFLVWRLLVFDPTFYILKRSSLSETFAFFARGRRRQRSVIKCWSCKWTERITLSPSVRLTFCFNPFSYMTKQTQKYINVSLFITSHMHDDGRA